MTTAEQFALVRRTIYPGAAEAHAARAALSSLEEQLETVTKQRDAIMSMLEAERPPEEVFAYARSLSNQHSTHPSGEMWGLWKLRRYGGNAVLGEQEANELVDAHDRLVEQLEAYEMALLEIERCQQGANYMGWIAREVLASNPASVPLSQVRGGESAVACNRESPPGTAPEPPPASEPESA